MTHFADPDDVEQAANGWTNAVVQCRTYSHSWHPMSVTHQPGFYTITQRCSRRCGCTRVCTMDERGYMQGTWQIRYPQGYLMDKGAGRVDFNGRARLRLVSLRSFAVVEVPPDGS